MTLFSSTIAAEVGGWVKRHPPYQELLAATSLKNPELRSLDKPWRNPGLLPRIALRLSRLSVELLFQPLWNAPF